jgi:hypothetical protein
MVASRRAIAVLVSVMYAFVLLTTAMPAHATDAQGSFQMNVRGYMVTGLLDNAVVQQDGSISMTMNVDSSVQTFIGQVPIKATGQWEGKVDGTTISGVIKNVNGQFRVCYFFFFCGTANFTGQGQWTGTLEGADGTGAFVGTITFNSSSFPQIPLNEPQPVSGSWNAEFQLPPT